MQFGLWDLWGHMGWLARSVVIVLLGMSIIMIGIAIERWIVLRRAREANHRLLVTFEKLVGAGDWQKAATSPRTEERSPLSRILPAGVESYLHARKNHELSRAEVLGHTEASLLRVAEREVLDLRRGLGFLGTTGSTAPFIGLFGTVVGIVNAFREIAQRGSGGLGTVSAGIAEALVTTAFGILVAIPAVMLYNYFTNRVDEADAELRDAGAALLEAIRRTGPADGKASAAAA